MGVELVEVKYNASRPIDRGRCQSQSPAVSSRLIERAHDAREVAVGRRVEVLLAGGCAVLLGGLIGLVWWWRRDRPPFRRQSAEPRSRTWRIGLAMMTLLLVIVGVGIVWRSKVAFSTVATCRAPSGVMTTTEHRPVNPLIAAEKVITWPETGIGILYGDVAGASLCWYQPADYYVDFHSGTFAGARIMNIGDVTLAPPFNMSVQSGHAVADHEARHRSQWALVTALGGPLAFPILYGIDDFFFPGSRNHFERLAGLDSGGYEHVGIAPVIGWLQLVVLLSVAALIAVLVWRRRRRRPTYPISEPDCEPSRPRPLKGTRQPPRT
jgi:hypothetical protein